MRFTPVAVLATSLLVPGLAFAQIPAVPAGAPSDTAAVAREAQNAAEDLVLMRVLVTLRLTENQLRELLPLVQGAQSRLQALERENAETLARHRQALQEVRDQLLAGQQTSPRAEAQYAEAVKLAESKRAQIRKDLVGSLKRALATYLGAQQEALIIQAAQAVSMQERVAGYRVQAMTGGRGGGPIGGMSRMMDRVREMSPDQFREMQQRMGGRGQGGRGPGGGQRGPQMAEFMAAIRAMPADAYQQQREALALQFWQANAGRFGEGTPADPQTQVDRFIERYFLSPRMAPAIQQRISQVAR